MILRGNKWKAVYAYGSIFLDIIFHVLSTATTNALLRVGANFEKEFALGLEL